MSLISRRIYEFGEFRLKITARLLERDGKPVPLGSKAFEVLTCLVVDAGQVVTKETLLKTVWPEAFVAEANLTQHIFALRKAFGDRSALIVTVPGRGYQFTGQVREVELAPATPSDYGSFLLQRTSERTRIIIEDTTQIATSALTLPLDARSAPISLTAHAASTDGVAPNPPALESMVVVRKDSSVRRFIAVGRSIAAGLLRRCMSLPQRVRRGRVPPWPAAAGLVLILLAAWFVPRRDAPTPHPSRRAVVTAFENRTRDPEFDVMLRKTLEIDLNQSPYLDVVSGSEIEPMQETALVAAAARQLCQRSDHPALILGSVANVGRLYLLTIEATDCESGRLLASTKATAESKEQMLDTIDAASVRLRKALGEPQASVDRFQSPAPQP
jgi:DNA-binding winged helix-turn-helix (wHTH) protein